MGRNKILSDEQVKDLFDKYLILNCNGDLNKFSFTEFSEYLIELGFQEVSARLLRRNKSLRAYMIEKTPQDKEKGKPALVFKDLDVDIICSKRNNLEYLRSTLTIMNEHYRSIYQYAIETFNENKKLKGDIETLKNKKQEENEKSKNFKHDISIKKDELEHLKNENKKLRELIDIYIYPEIANELLKKKGLLKKDDTIIDPDIVDHSIITAESNLKEIIGNVNAGLIPKNNIRNNIIKGLFAGMEEN